MCQFKDKVRRMHESGGFFDRAEPVCIGRAPGRMDLMGGNVDYTGGLVFEMTIREATWAGAQLRHDSRIVLRNPQMREHGWKPDVEFRLEDLNDEAVVRTFVNKSPEVRWTAYVLGVFCYLRKWFPSETRTGINLYLESNVPLNKGVSSSAAVEVAAMKTACQAYRIPLQGIELARACQWVENTIAESACGIMDQAAIVLGRAGYCLPLLCQPCLPFPLVKMPADLTVWGIDSGVRHAVTGIEYEAARAACFMGYKLICDWNGLKLQIEECDGISRYVDTHWVGYPSNISPSEFRSSYEQRLPEVWTGAEYLQKADFHIDPYTQVRKDVAYRIRACMRYAVEENHRIQTFVELVRTSCGTATESAFALLGELMYQSHYSYTECGLGSEATDMLVDLVREEGVANGLFGAKITGGGAGGTVAVLGRKDAAEAFTRVVERYKEHSGISPYVFEGNSDGADYFGTVQA
ncbi:MAG TPA: galactokinase family protein [Terriglobia bacterium]|nr:galactokinase family protein [Terriglobia bacterium]